MNVVIVDGDVSYPPTSGKRLRTLNLMLPLARRHRLTYLARGHGKADEEREAVAFLRDHGIAALVVEDPLPRKKGVGFYARLASNLFSPLPYAVASHRSEKMRQVVAAHAAAHPVDLWQLEFSGYLYALAGQSAPVVVQAHNIETLLWKRYHDAERRTLRRWYIARQWRKYERFERQAFRAVTRVITVSPEDASYARQHFSVERIDVVDNGVDVESFRQVRPVADSQRILYLGALDWRPNLDALVLLLDRIFPAVRARHREARLQIVGRHAPAWLARRVAAMANVELHADVPDVRPHLAAAAVLAVPLRIGGGSRLKILEALASGLPVVSTRVGAEGLALRPGQDYTLADAPEEIAAALVTCLQQPEWARGQAEHGRRTVSSRYDWSLLADRLERVWERAVQRRAEA